jgi:hypothetical protein
LIHLLKICITVLEDKNWCLKNLCKQRLCPEEKGIKTYLVFSVTQSLHGLFPCSLFFSSAAGGKRKPVIDHNIVMKRRLPSLRRVIFSSFPNIVTFMMLIFALDQKLVLDGSNNDIFNI